MNNIDLKLIKKYVDTKVTNSDLVGKSAYQIAVDHGFTGSEAEWLASLQGEEQDISGKENISNKVTNLSSDSTDIQYPSAKAVYDFTQGLGNEFLNFCGDMAHIITVYNELPENPDNNGLESFYKLITGTLVRNYGKIANVNIIMVNQLPTENIQPCVNEDFSQLYLYFIIGHEELYGWVSEAYESVLGMSEGWYDGILGLELFLNEQNLEFDGVICDIKDNHDEENNADIIHLLIEYKLYSYFNGQWLSTGNLFKVSYSYENGALVCNRTFDEIYAAYKRQDILIGTISYISGGWETLNYQIDSNGIHWYFLYVHMDKLNGTEIEHNNGDSIILQTNTSFPSINNPYKKNDLPDQWSDQENIWFIYRPSLFHGENKYLAEDNFHFCVVLPTTNIETGPFNYYYGLDFGYQCYLTEQNISEYNLNLEVGWHSISEIIPLYKQLNDDETESQYQGIINNIQTDLTELILSPDKITYKNVEHYGIFINNKIYFYYDDVIKAQIGGAEGISTYSYGQGSHAEGIDSETYGQGSHAEGYNSMAQGHYSHAEGYATQTTGNASHAEGYTTQAIGHASHAEGYETCATGSASHVEGRYNIRDNTIDGANPFGTYVEIVGNGSDDQHLSNARTLDWNGNEILAGKLTVGVGPTNNMDVTTKQYVDNQYSSKENVNNKVTSLSSNSTDTQYPSAKLVYDQLALKQNKNPDGTNPLIDSSTGKINSTYITDGQHGDGYTAAQINNNGDLIVTEITYSGTSSSTRQVNLGHVVGANGNDYVLTAQDKTDIANIALQLLPTTQEVLYGNTSN